MKLNLWQLYLRNGLVYVLRTDTVSTVTHDRAERASRAKRREICYAGGGIQTTWIPLKAVKFNCLIRIPIFFTHIEEP